ncbi:MAG: prepilin-type N-terminal cleavage/methylation domain-containing protein [Desulfobacterales bacterium]|jgi:type IV pilus assembly protein PilA
MITAKTAKLGSGGFTLVELMIVIAIIGILAAIAVPNFMQYRKKAEIAEIAVNIKNFEKGFIAYVLDEGDYPDDCHTDNGFFGLPDEIQGVPNTNIVNYVLVGEWVTPTALGGRYNWEGPDTYWPNYPDGNGYIGISIDQGTAPDKDFSTLDSMLDDGNLGTGKFQKTTNGRYTYMIESNGY